MASFKEISNNLIVAVREGKLVDAQHLINTYGFCLRDWEQGFTLLCGALETKQSEVAAFLLSSGAKVKNNKPLLLAVINGDIEVAKLLLTRAPYKAKEEYIQTSLFYAALNADYPMFKLLLEHGASVKKRQSLLCGAVKADCIELVEALLKEGVSAEESEFGKNALWYAIDNMNLLIVRLLLRHGAKLSEKTNIIVKWMERQKELADAMSPENREAKMKELLNDSDWGHKLLLAAVSEEFVKVAQSLLDYTAGCKRYFRTYLCIAVFGACENISTKMVEMLVKKGVDVNSKDIYSYGSTPLHTAGYYMHRVHVESKRNDSPMLNNACYHCSADMVKMLLLQSTKVNNWNNAGQSQSTDGNNWNNAGQSQSTDGNNWNYYNYKSPLQISCKSNTRRIELLLKHGADLNSRDDDGRTPLHFAYHLRNTYVVKMLLKLGADFNAKDNDGRTVLYSASARGDTETIEILLKYGANVNIRDNDWKTPLHCASYNSSADVVELLFKHGADLNENDLKGQTALHIASSHLNTKTLEVLLKLGADVDRSRDSDGQTLLHFASSRGCTSAVEILLKHGAEVNACDIHEQTAICAASFSGKIENVELLLKNGADVNLTGNDGVTALQGASCNGYTEIVEILLKHGADLNAKEYEEGQTAFYQACNSGYIETVEMLLKYGADVNISENDGKTALYAATYKCYTDMVEMLLKHGADSNIRDVDGRTALHVASNFGFTKILEILLKYGADLSNRNIYGHTPLHESGRFSEGLKMLLMHGADVNSRDNKGESALHFASTIRKIEPVEVLLKNEADVNIRNNLGRTPLHVACGTGNDTVVEILLKYGADVNIADNNNELPITIISIGQLEPPRAIQINSLLIREMVKMISMGLYVSQENVVVMSGEKMIDYKVKCENEIAVMKVELFHEAFISFFNILVGNTRSLVGYLRNAVVMQAVTSETFKSQYPIYSHQIENKLMEALGMKELMEKASDIICSLVGKPLPDVCIHRILRFLTSSDMENFIENF